MLFSLVIGAVLGVTICTESWELFYVTLVTRFVALKLIISVLRLYFNNNIEEFYGNIALSPLILLAFIPSTLFYYFYLLPIYIELQGVILDNFHIMKNNLVKLALSLIKVQMNYVEKIWINIIIPCFGDFFRPVLCDSPEEIAKLFKELPFSHVDSEVMVEECRTSTNHKTREALIAEYKAFRKDIGLYTPSSMQSGHSNESTVELSESSKGQLYKGRKIAFSYSEGELSNLNKSKRIAFDNTASSNVNSISREDFLYYEFNYEIVYRKISNLIEEGGISKRDTLSKLPLETQSQTLRKNFYHVLEALELTKNKRTYTTKIGYLLETLEQFIQITPIKQNKDLQVFTGGPNLSLQNILAKKDIFVGVLRRLNPNVDVPDLSSLPIISKTEFDTSPNLSIFQKLEDDFYTILDDFVSLRDKIILLDANSEILESIVEQYDKNLSDYISVQDDPRNILVAKIITAISAVDVILSQPDLDNMDRIQLAQILEALQYGLEEVKS